MTYRIDQGDRHGGTCLALCTTGACGWRGQPTINRDAALMQAAAHERTAHPADHSARTATRRCTRKC